MSVLVICKDKKLEREAKIKLILGGKALIKYYHENKF